MASLADSSRRSRVWSKVDMIDIRSAWMLTAVGLARRVCHCGPEGSTPVSRVG